MAFEERPANSATATAPTRIRMSAPLYGLRAIYHRQGAVSLIVHEKGNVYTWGKTIMMAKLVKAILLVESRGLEVKGIEPTPAQPLS
ncbi:hypothetical protein BLX41_14405 [Pseudomonas protegens]|nr:hypothetical protein BLX41_14405 [Pseudomonas protegens]